MKTNTGKIARLPREVRDELNRRLDDGEDGPTLLAWLNARPGTPNLLQAPFAGQPINRQNLSDWRQNGFLEWQRHQEAMDLAGRLLEDTREMEKLAAAGPLADRLAHLVAISLGHLLQAATRLPDGPEKTRAVLNSARELIRLRHSEREFERANREQQDWQREKRDQAEEDREKADRQRKDRLLAPLTAERTRKIMALAYQSDGHTEAEAEEIARFRTAVEYDLPESEWKPPSNASSIASATEDASMGEEASATENPPAPVDAICPPPEPAGGEPACPEAARPEPVDGVERVESVNAAKAVAAEADKPIPTARSARKKTARSVKGDRGKSRPVKPSQGQSSIINLPRQARHDKPSLEPDPVPCARM